MSLPLVSCIMPTYGRPDYVAESIAMFLAQDYPSRELIILNDCPGQLLLGEFPGVRIINSPNRWATLGEKRNAAIELARGDFIAVWDDDDVYMPWRLSHSMARIQELNAPIYCPTEYWAYWGEGNVHENQAVLNWIYHPVVVFRKDLWRTVGGYPAQTLCEDTAFFTKALQHLGIQWPRDPITRTDRLMILRGQSKYHHTSIDGGSQGPDISAREVHLAAHPIDDTPLRSLAEELIQRRTDQRLRRTISHEKTRNWPGIPDGAQRFWLDEFTPQSQIVGFGDVGRNGHLGYEWKHAEINGEFRTRTISAHAPSRLSYQLNGRFSHFCCQVALNDDVGCDVSAADFHVLADGRLVGVARNVRSGQVLRSMTVDIRGARELELIVQHHQWNFCHSVWVDPFLVSVAPQNLKLVDGLGRAEISIPANLARMELCIATTGSPGYEDWIDDLFGSIHANAQCPHAQLAIFFFGESEEIRRIARKHGALLIPCRPIKPLNCTAKSVMYSAGRVIPADKFICLDADMLVMDDLRPIVAGIAAAPEGSILVCRESLWAADLAEGIRTIYGGCPADIEGLVACTSPKVLQYPLLVNDGLFAGTAAALSGVDDIIRGLHKPEEWMEDPRANIPWRNQFLFNLALAQGECAIELAPRFNVQLNSQRVEFRTQEGSTIATTFAGWRAAIVHFNGVSRHYFPEWRGRYRAIQNPIRHDEQSVPAYQLFVESLRRWLGERGRDGLTWSFYGTHDGHSGRECSSSDFPLLATLHYLIRSNGCCRVIETGTARGVSTACLASAVAYRPNAAVVTIDLTEFSERASLWSLLPDSMRQSIIPRRGDSIDGLKSALANGETYDAAILDSLHTCEHVLQEFESASQLVCRGGLILIHDAVLPFGTVDRALDRIAEMGYGVTRLWTAESGSLEDGGFGLAVIENRRRGRVALSE